MKTTKAFNYVNWPIDNVLAFITTRQHPLGLSGSSAPFSHFNLGTHVNERPEDTQANRQTLSQFLPQTSQIQWLNQVHGSDVAYVEHAQAKALTADAAITNKKNISLAVMTADCLPILLAAENGSEVAAIHGGWRPLAAGIIGNTLEKMVSDVKQIRAWLGPCIGKTAFEVGQEVKDMFVEQNSAFAEAFVPHVPGKYFADLHFIARIQLQQLGVKTISALSDCTYLDDEQYYSYRRENVTGRMATVITCLP
ncbi:peptidoglycan editing factor PgeF [Thalassotalea sp. PLHSN55]|uniref:peptidoglycan editing factor PgeF n=1 Tax=Thalassotalea sp. PLHSN55 TaxID=3435888 RepID=UPI003F863AB3